MERVRRTRLYAFVDRIPSIRDLNKVTVGVVSIVVIGVLIAFAFAIGTFGLFQPSYTMSGVFTDTGGLKTGREVRVAGVKVGKVTSVEPDFDKGQVVISWKVNGGVELGPQTRADIVVANLLGGHYIRLSGPVEAPHMDDVPAAKRRIPLERTKTPFSVIDALGTTVRKVQALDIDAVNRVVREFADATDKSGAAFGAFVSNLAKVSAALGERDDVLERLIASSQRVTSTLADKDAELVQLVDSAHVLLTRLDARRAELASVLGSSSRVVDKLADLVAGQRGQLNAIIADLQTVVEAAGRQLPAINTGLAWTGPMFAGLGTVGGQGPWADLVVYGLGPDAIQVICNSVPDLQVGCGAPPQQSGGANR